MHSSDLNIRSNVNPILREKGDRCALTIGNFDGCHVGHQSLISRALELALEMKLASASLTFWPRPDVFFNPEREASGSLFTESMKSRAFHECGISVHYTQEFNNLVSQMAPESFFETVLIQRLRAAAIVVGENFRFGKGRTGDGAFLKSCGRKQAVVTEIKSFATFEGDTVSSTRIRNALRIGDVGRAAKMLGRPYLLEGTLRKGDQLGRTIGFPTLNLATDGQLLPANGVYAGFVWVKGICEGDAPKMMSVPPDSLPAAINIGVRPTVSGTSLRIEAYVLSEFPHRDSYDQKAGFYFTHRIRSEERFSGLCELKQQIQDDIAQARALLR